MTEYTRLLLIVLGFTLASAGYVWLLSRAFRQGNWWGTLLFFFPPLALVYLVVKFPRAWMPMLLILVGAFVVFLPYGVKYYPRYFIDLGPRIKDVDGEKHVTLTGWDRKDYDAILAAWPDAVVVQMANEDVTDETVKSLAEFKKLRVLDLDGTQVGDKGMEILGKLPALEVLRVRNTHVTDEGFRKFLAPMPSLKQVYYRGSGIEKSTLADWKSKKPAERTYLP
jgi:hypothetical protein